MKIPPPFCALVLLAPAFACSRPAANGLLCSDASGCPAGFQCYATSAMEKRCYDRPLPACSPDALRCEDFEGALAGWTIVNYHQSTVQLDTTRAHSGVQSLHAAVLPHDPAAPPPENISQAQVTQTLSIAPDIFMRFFLYQPAIFPSIVEIAALLGNEGDYLGASLWLNSGRLSVDAPYNIADQITPDALSRPGNRLLPENRWICLEWQVHVGNPGEMRVWVNDEEQTELYLAADTTLVAPASGAGTVVTAGLGFFTDQHVDFSSFDVWLDDIAVSPQRLHCN